MREYPNHALLALAAVVALAMILAGAPWSV